MDKLLTLTALRRVSQLFFFVLLVYGALFLNTFYSEDKLTQALPALSCAYDKQGGDYCVLIPLQHQMDHRVSGVIGGNMPLMAGLMGTLITLGVFAVLIVIFNKAFCGWSCPLGFFQEVIHMIASKLGIAQITSLSPEQLKKVRPIKWLLFAFLIFIFPILTGLGFVGHELGDPFCRICPSRILTTLATGDTSQLYIDSSSWGYMALSIIADLLFGLMIALALFIRQPFCRICPMLPMQTVFKKLGLLRLVKNGASQCEGCGQCVKACPMDIFEIQQTAEHKNITFEDCTLCGRCVEFCPHDGVMALKYGPLPLFSSSKQYFKKRIKIEKWSKA
ncbi:MAG: 4Fe-4S binding protein [Campylobacterales bacterium]|nr:4Fe-4S binding protein [Campylobacterales bacterium]